jgi:hypothetical protein
VLISSSAHLGTLPAFELPVVENPCPVDGYTKREYVKQLIKTLGAESPGLRERLFNAIRTGNIDGWGLPDKTDAE